MSRFSSKALLPLVTALFVLVAVVYGACLSCQKGGLITEVSKGDCCADDFATDWAPEACSCCEKSQCVDQEAEPQAFSGRQIIVAPELLVAGFVAAPLPPDPAHLQRHALPFRATAPPDKTYLQHSAFLC